MTKCVDTRNAGRSRIAPYIQGEEPSHRHFRRKRTAEATRADVEAWCRHQGLRLKISNDGHHWQFRNARGQLAEWWPSSAKLVLLQQYSRGIHCHDWRQVTGILLQRRFAEAAP